VRILFTEGHRLDAYIRVGNHHYATLFARHGHHVAWITNPVSPWHLLAVSKLLREHRKRYKLWIQGGRFAADGIFQYCPLTLLPYNNMFPFKSKLTLRKSFDLCLPSIGRVLAKKGFLPLDLLWVSAPYFIYLAVRLRPRRIVYRVADNWTGFTQLPANIVEAECIALQMADLVLSTSRVQQERLKRIRPDVYYLPNGVEWEHFALPKPEPLEYKELKRPIAVYVGNLSYWVDIQLLSEVARRMPSWSFVLIGPVETSLTPLRSLWNVKLLGPRPYRQLPGYLQWANVGLIPFQRSTLTESVNPVKVYEYLASGLPVVATRWTELELTGLPVRLASCPSEFCKEMEEALGEDQPEQRRQRAELMYLHSWEVRYAELLNHLKRLGL
jgi:glycosyltransferase involved in cell wall biosynthesis